MNIKMAKDLTTPTDLSKEVTYCSTFMAACIKPAPHFVSQKKARFIKGGMQESYKCLLDNRVYVVTIKPEGLKGD